ncbi:MAG: LysM peptidoglycan-binding domain-containing protein [Actinomycetes bacterium]
MASISVPARLASTLPGTRGGSVQVTQAGYRQGAPTRIRLTARAKRLLTATGVVLAISVTTGVFPGGSWGEQSTPAPGETAAQRMVQVRAGDSLWQIAVRAMPDVAPTDAIAQLRAANGPAAQDLRPGQMVVVPGSGG